MMHLALVILLASPESANGLLAAQQLGLDLRGNRYVNQSWRDVVLRQIDFASIDDTASDRAMRTLGATEDDPAALLRRFPLGATAKADGSIAGPEALRRTLSARRSLRAATTERQLYERVVEFWLAYFEVDTHDARTLYGVALLESGIRQHALGSFRDLLGVATLNPAVLQSFASNNALAERMLDRWTVGPNGYVAEDVDALTNVLSGWRVFDSTGDLRSPVSGHTFFLRSEHTAGNQELCGSVIADNGAFTVGHALDALTTHPATAQTVARALVAHFVGADAPMSLVHRVADVYLNTDGDIRAVMTALTLDPTTIALAER